MHTQKRINGLIKDLFANLDRCKITYCDELLSNVVNDTYRTATCDMINNDTKPIAIIEGEAWCETASEAFSNERTTWEIEQETEELLAYFPEFKEEGIHTYKSTTIIWPRSNNTAVNSEKGV